MFRTQKLKDAEHALLILAIIWPIDLCFVKSSVLDIEKVVFFREESEVYEVREAVDLDVDKMLYCGFVPDCLVRD